MLIRVLAIYPGFDPAINEMAMAWEKCVSSGDLEFLAFAPTYDQLKNTATQNSNLKRGRFSINWIKGSFPLRLDKSAIDAAIEFNPDIVVSGTAPNLKAARKIATRVNAKLVLHQEFFQTDDLFVNRRKYLGLRFMLPSVARYLRSNILQQVDRVWISDPVEAKNNEDKSGKLRYLPWPHPDPEPEGVTAAADRDLNKIVYIGSISKAKSADVLAEYLCELLQRFPEKNLELVGPVIDATGKAALQKISDCAGERLAYRPSASRSESMKMLSGAPFVFIPGTSLSWGLIGDAWRRGTLVLVQAEHYDLVKDENCMVVRTADEFIETVKKLEGNPAFSTRILEAAEKTGRAHSPEAVSKVLGKLIAEVMRPESATTVETAVLHDVPSYKIAVGVPARVL